MASADGVADGEMTDRNILECALRAWVAATRVDLEIGAPDWAEGKPGRLPSTQAEGHRDGHNGRRGADCPRQGK